MNMTKQTTYENKTLDKKRDFTLEEKLLFENALPKFAEYN